MKFPPDPLSTFLALAKLFVHHGDCSEILGQVCRAISFLFDHLIRWSLFEAEQVRQHFIMSEFTDFVTTISSAASALATTVAAAGILYAHRQLRTTREIAQLQFEDKLAKEYRDLANRLPTNALLGDELPGAEYADAFDELFHYIDLSNEQVYLRQRNRIGKDVWKSWCEGIKSNLSLPAFRRAWSEVKLRSRSFHELRRLEDENFEIDPILWS